MGYGAFYLQENHRMALSKKLRFEVLQRDNHCCMYCGRKPPYVMLEVDHIVPKKNWWLDILENLNTSCFDCNRGKWWDTKEENNWKLYKRKIESTKTKLKNYIYSKWNKKYMWTIDKNTCVLMRFYIDTMLDDWSIKESVSIDSYLNWTENDYTLFMIWWEYCDWILDWLYENWCNDIEEMIEYVYDKDWWTRSSDEDYWWKLNYRLTLRLKSIYDEKDYYVIRKFTQFSRLLDDDSFTL